MPKKSYLTIDREIVGEVSSGARSNYVRDVLGSVVAMTDAANLKVFMARYKPYGATMSSTGSPPSFTWVGVLGYLTSAGSARCELKVRTRFYSNGNSAWASLDPLWPSFDAFSYADSNPTTNADPTGLHVVKRRRYSGDAITGNCGAFQMEWTFSISPKDRNLNGWLIQHMNIAIGAKTCEGSPIDPYHGQCGVNQGHVDYYEAWPIVKGVVLLSNGLDWDDPNDPSTVKRPHDTWGRYDDYSCSHGPNRINASVMIWPNSLPSQFQPGTQGGVPCSGYLPSAIFFDEFDGGGWGQGSGGSPGMGIAYWNWGCCKVKPNCPKPNKGCNENCHEGPCKKASHTVYP